jgi:hypothetical protein
VEIMAEERSDAHAPEVAPEVEADQTDAAPLENNTSRHSINFAPINLHHTDTRASRTMTRNSTRRSMNRTRTRESYKEVRDPQLDINLPYRTFTIDANLEEYTTEQPTGTISGGVDEAGVPYELVTFLPNDPDNPKNWSKLYKWYCTMVVAVTCFVVALCSSVITPGYVGVAEEFNVSNEVALLSITVFVIGFGVGKLHDFSSQPTFG